MRSLSEINMASEFMNTRANFILNERLTLILPWLKVLVAWCFFGMLPVEANSQNTSSPIRQHDERRILVAFGDANISRIAIGDGVGGYRRRGHYDSSTWGRDTVEDLEHQYHVKTLDQWPIPALDMHCAVYRVPEGRSVNETLAALSRDGRIALSEPMRTFRTQAGGIADPYAQLQKSLVGLKLPEAHHYSTGSKVDIAIIDTGIDTDHPDLQNQVVEVRDFSQQPATDIADIHGTAVAGIIAAAAKNGIGITGVAPGARLHALKACWPEQFNRPEATCNSFTLALALNSAIESKVKVVNMSLAGPYDPLLGLLINKGISQGIIFTASLPLNKGEPSFPATVPGVIAVSSESSSFGIAAQNSVVAPGDKLLTTLPQGTYNFVTGSSYATAVISGLAALILEIDPEIKVSEILKAVRGDNPQGGLLANLGTRNVCSVLASLVHNRSIACDTPPVLADLGLPKH